MIFFSVFSYPRLGTDNLLPTYTFNNDDLCAQLLCLQPPLTSVQHNQSKKRTAGPSCTCTMLPGVVRGFCRRLVESRAKVSIKHSSDDCSQWVDMGTSIIMRVHLIAISFQICTGPPLNNCIKYQCYQLETHVQE